MRMSDEDASCRAYPIPHSALGLVKPYAACPDADGNMVGVEAVAMTQRNWCDSSQPMSTDRFGRRSFDPGSNAAAVVAAVDVVVAVVVVTVEEVGVVRFVRDRKECHRCDGDSG